MSTSQVSQVFDKDGVMRPLAKFPLDIWGDRFLNYNSEQDKEEVRMELLAIVNRPLLEQIKLVDIVEHLGVECHFETEIERVLQHICDTYYHGINHPYDLCTTAFGFRLLRQHGHHISSDIFNKFIDENGNFKEYSLTSDVLGMLSLYEAAQLEGHGEDILDKATVFTTAHLQSMSTHLSNPLASQITHRIELKHFFSIYHYQPLHNQALLRLAKLDFNLLQSLHKKELCQLSLWWKKSDFVGKLSFARNRLVECYFWILGMYNEPYYAVSRRMLVKAAVILTILDDKYDAYGTPDELKLFTEVVERPKLITASELMLRLLEVVRSHKFERQRTSHIPSSVVCYIKEYGVSEQEAYEELNKQIDDSWKDINEECLNLTHLPRSLIKIILDFTRMTHVIYDGDDNFTRVGKQMQAHIASLLIDPVPI
ncbi:hypothetical protein ACOSQ3_017637 [Xanthoceras sorbifolium]